MCFISIPVRLVQQWFTHFYVYLTNIYWTPAVCSAVFWTLEFAAGNTPLPPPWSSIIVAYSDPDTETKVWSQVALGPPQHAVVINDWGGPLPSEQAPEWPARGPLTDRGRRPPGSGDSGAWRRGAWLMQSGWRGGQRERGRRSPQDRAGRVWAGGRHAGNHWRSLHGGVKVSGLCLRFRSGWLFWQLCEEQVVG